MSLFFPLHPALPGPFDREALGFMARTDVAIRKARPRAKPSKMGDALGLFVLIRPSGGKLWRFRYRFDGREKKLAIESYPVMALSEARRRRDQARERLAAGKDPSRERQGEKLRTHVQAGNTFAAIAEEYARLHGMIQN